MRLLNKLIDPISPDEDTTISFFKFNIMQESNHIVHELNKLTNLRISNLIQTRFIQFLRYQKQMTLTRNNVLF